MRTLSSLSEVGACSSCDVAFSVRNQGGDKTQPRETPFGGLRPGSSLLHEVQGKRAGFTLVEVLLALALLAALLAALNHFVFSIAEAWTKDQDRFVFAQHTRAVSRHLDELLRASAATARASGTTDGAPGATETRLSDGSEALLVTFDLPNGDRVLTWEERPLPEVRCALGWRRDEGLVLYYKSRLEEDFADGEPRVAVLSPFVTQLSYDYFDDQFKAWRTEDRLREQDGAGVAPRRVRIKFQRGNQEYTEIVTLPVPVEGVPVY